MKLPAYPKCKASGVEWLGEVPEHWDVKRLKMAVLLTDHKVEADEENPVPYIGMENIESWTGRLLPINPDVVPTGTANTFATGDTLFGKLRPYLAKACNPDFGGLCSTELLVLKGCLLDRRALIYLLLSDGFIKLVDSSTYGSKMPRASWDFVGSCVVPIAPPGEQRAIADFLDRETAKIDELVAKKRTLIERLKEKRTALISHTVTRGLPPAAARAAGLDPNPKLKSSGIDWIGHIPAHWEVRRFRNLLTRLDQGLSPVAASWPASDGEWGVLKLSAARDGRFIPEENKALDDDFDGTAQATPQAGDLLISRSNTPDRVGDVGLVLVDSPLLLIPDLLYRAKLDGRMASPAFVCLFLLSKCGRVQIEADARGSSGSMVKLGQGHLRAWLIPCPPIEEQDQIVKFLGCETDKIESMVSMAESAIERLQEYRTALITAAVSGKVDVRHHAQKGS